jgi:radical SAM protein with 4Fe4S-binding SPASM domain
MMEKEMKSENIPINKGNYSMDTVERERKFEMYRGLGWEERYIEYRNSWTLLAKNKIVSEYPLLVDIELSSLCNLRCKMCYTITDEFKSKVNTTRMEWELYKKIIDEISGKVPAIRLSLRGEAMLHKKFAECVGYAKSKGIGEVSTLTHGGKLTPDFFLNIAKSGIDWITVSVDGVNEVYEKIRKPLKFDDIVDKLTRIKEIKEDYEWKRPVIKVQGIWPAIQEDAEEYYSIFEPISDLIAFNPLIDYLSNDDDIEYMGNFSCPQQYQRLVIGADGLVMKCSNDEENIEVVGNLNNESVYDIWHGDKLQSVRELHKRDNGFLEDSVCRKCYLPRQTKDEICVVQEREFKIPNYTNRIQLIGA